MLFGSSPPREIPHDPLPGLSPPRRLPKPPIPFDFVPEKQREPSVDELYQRFQQSESKVVGEAPAEADWRDSLREFS